MKNCGNCGRRKPDTEFIKAKGGKTSSWCATCRRKKAAQHRRAYYAGLPADKRHTLTHRRRARAAGVAHESYSRSEIFRRWRLPLCGTLCVYCWWAPAEHLDHVHPISKGGEDAQHNVVPACKRCNLEKGSMTLAEWALRELPPPF